MDAGIKELVRDVDKLFLLSTDRIFNIKGRGCVTTGTLESGVCKLGDKEIVGKRRKLTKTTITGVDMFKNQLDYA